VHCFIFSFKKIFLLLKKIDYGHNEQHLQTPSLAKMKQIIIPVTVFVFILSSVITHALTKILNTSTASQINLTNLTYIDPVRYVFPDAACDTPKGAAFLYDLGGTECACASRWDKGMYWEKVFSGWAFHLPHLSTPMQMQIIIQKWEWTLLWMCFNEIIEEVQLGITGMWGFTYDPFQDMEPRYDSLLRDILICGVPAVLAGMYFIHTTQTYPFFKMPLQIRGSLLETGSLQRLILCIFQFLTLERINLMYNVSMGAHHFYVENLILIPANILCVWLIYYSNVQAGIITKAEWWVHVHWSAIQVFIWLPSVYPVLDEIYLVYLSLGLICIYLTVVKKVKQYTIQASEGIELVDDQEEQNTQSKNKNILEPFDVFMLFLLPLSLIVFACVQPMQYKSNIRYTRMGCGQFWGKDGRFNGVGCKEIH